MPTSLDLRRPLFLFLMKNNCFIANLTQCGEKAAFKMSADETLSETEAWGSFIPNSGQNEVQTQISIWKFSYHLPGYIREINGFLRLSSVEDSSCISFSFQRG